MCGVSKPDRGWLQETTTQCFHKLHASTSAESIQFFFFEHDSVNSALYDSGHVAKYLCLECFNMLNRIQKTEDDLLKQMNDNLAARVAKNGREFGLSPLAPATHA